MKNAAHFINLFILICALCACAFREKPDEHSTATENKFLDLYSRNFIVATPTATANAICAPVGAVGILALLPETSSSSSSLNGDGILALMELGGLVGGGACGMVVGSPFIPLSYMCDENPWYYQGTDLTTNWYCDAQLAR